ncbi:MAG: hypothetical protein ACXVCI_11640 [Bdellovibrionota bacterium]
MRFPAAPAFLLALISTTAFADNVNLFVLRKPKNPENLVQTFVPVTPDCRLGDIDFYWLMNGKDPKVPNGILRCNVLKRLKSVRVDPNNKAACPKQLPPGTTCTQKFYTADEIGKTGQNAPLVIKATRTGSKCSVGAFIDTGSKVVEVKQVNTNGKILSQGLIGATILFSDVEVFAEDSTRAADWKCQNDCMENVSADFSCHMP